MTRPTRTPTRTAPARSGPIRALAAALALCVLAAPVALAAPEPRPVATSWEFTFEEGPLRLAWVETEGGNRPYFYFTYRVTNHWGSDLLFAPDVSLVTSDAEVLPSGRGVPAAVIEEIMGRLRNPLLESQYSILSTVLEGPEHAREGIAVWPATSMQVDELSIYFGGLSGENEAYVIGRDTDDPRRYTLRKTMMLRYATPGDFTRQGSRPFELIEKRWVMR